METWNCFFCFNTLRSRQNGRLFADDTFKRIFLNENIRFSIKISLKFVPKGLSNNIPALVLIMAWRRPGDKPLSEPMMVRSLTHICVTRPQWIKTMIRYWTRCSMDRELHQWFHEDVMSHTRHISNGCLTKPPPKLGHGCVMSSRCLCGWIYPGLNHNAGLANVRKIGPRAPSQYKDRLIYVWWFPC